MPVPRAVGPRGGGGRESAPPAPQAKKGITKFGQGAGKTAEKTKKNQKKKKKREMFATGKGHAFRHCAHQQAAHAGRVR